MRRRGVVAGSAIDLIAFGTVLELKIPCGLLTIKTTAPTMQQKFFCKFSDCAWLLYLCVGIGRSD